MAATKRIADPLNVEIEIGFCGDIERGALGLAWRPGIGLAPWDWPACPGIVLGAQGGPGAPGSPWGPQEAPGAPWGPGPYGALGPRGRDSGRPFFRLLPP